MDRYPPQARVEWLIAGARLVLAVGGLFAVWIDPTTKSEAIGYALGISYVTYSLAMVAMVRTPVRFVRGWDFAGHGVDLVAFSLFMYFTEGPTSPFFIYFIFSLVCGAVRWGARGVVITGVVALAAFIGISIYGLLYDPRFEFNRFIIRTVHLTVIGTLLAYLSAYHPRNLREALRFASWPHDPPRNTTDVVAEILERAHEIVPAPRLLLIWTEREEPTHVNLAWRGAAGREWMREPTTSHQPVVLRSLEDASFVATDAANPRAPIRFLSAGCFCQLRGVPLDQEFRARFNIRAVLSSPVEGELVRGRLFWLDRRRTKVDDVAVSELVARLCASRLDGALLIAHLEGSAALRERLRFGRELHDNLLQTLTSTALQLEAAMRLLDRGGPGARERLGEAQRQLAEMEYDIRSYIRRLRPGEAERVTPSRRPLDERFEALCERVKTQWQIDLTVELSLPQRALPNDLANQVYLIVQEAVVNAARHADATSVRVQITQELADHRVLVAIVDDGKGFPFAGSYDLAALNATGLGPVTLKERVAELGGDLRLFSGPSGAQIAVTLPLAQESRTGPRNDGDHADLH